MMICPSSSLKRSLLPKITDAGEQLSEKALVNRLLNGVKLKR